MAAPVQRPTSHKRDITSRSTSNDTPSKRKRSSPEAESTVKELELSIEVLEQQVSTSRKHYNNVALLLQHARSQDPQFASEAQLALCRVFCRLLTDGSLNSPKPPQGNEHVISQWLHSRLSEYRELLSSNLHTSTLRHQRQCLKLLMQLLKGEAGSRKESKARVAERLSMILDGLFANEASQEIRQFYIESFAGKYKDVIALTFQCLVSTIKKAEGQTTPRLLTDFMRELVDLEPEDLWHPSLAPKKDSSKDQADAWLALLSKNLSKQQRKVLLELTPTKIAPSMPRPERLLDFLTDAFNAGGSTALLALSGLFELIQSRNLDYPLFYRRVYSLLDPFILHSQHRSRFLRLLETFLESTHLPAILVASFIKRLSRLCLFAPPSAIAVIVPLVYNLFKAHPSCTFMIHRESCCEEHALKTDQDPFKMDEEDPMETNALETSLWEIYTLQSHYNPNVAVICKIISEQFTKLTFNMEDFLDHSYASMLEADLGKPLKKEPVLEYMIPKTIFPPPTNDTDRAMSDSFAIWAFSR